MVSARNSAVRAALLMLIEEPSFASGRVAECHIEEVTGSQEAFFKVDVQITELI